MLLLLVVIAHRSIHLGQGKILLTFLQLLVEMLIYLFVVIQWLILAFAFSFALIFIEKELKLMSKSMVEDHDEDTEETDCI